MEQPFRKSQGDIAITWASSTIGVFREGTGLPFAEWIDFMGIDYLDKIGKPSKKTLLHEYIECVITDAYAELLRKHFPAEVISDLYAVIRFYGIDITSLGEYKFFHIDNSDMLGENFKIADEYADKLWDFFAEKLLGQIVDDTFTILYADKTFLHDFNLAFSKIVRTLKKAELPKILKEDGVVKRCEYLPTWLKDGVFYRDKGRCQICGRDLTRLLNTDHKVNCDHIIPLQYGGTNDPTNFQITCESCNKSKQHRQTTSVNYLRHIGMLILKFPNSFVSVYLLTPNNALEAGSRSPRQKIRRGRGPASGTVENTGLLGT